MKKTHSGMTFVELTVWLGLLGMISITILTMVMFFYKRDDDLTAATSGSSTVRKTVDKIVKDIREATFAHNGSFVIASMSPYELTFYTDTDLDDATERVRYYVSGSTFYRGVTEPTGNPPVYTSPEVVTMISTSIMNQTNSVPMFRYYNSSAVEITDMTDIGDVAYFDIKVLVNRAPVYLTPRITEVRTSVSFRNPPGI
jgi:hypothetical protein